MFYFNFVGAPTLQVSRESGSDLRNLKGIVGRVDELAAVRARLLPRGFGNHLRQWGSLRRAFRAGEGVERDLPKPRLAAKGHEPRAAPLVRKNFKCVLPLLAGGEVSRLDRHLAPFHAAALTLS